MTQHGGFIGPEGQANHGWPGGAGELGTGCLARKVKIHQIGPASIRCVTHKDVDAEDIGRALDAFREITAPW